MRSWRVPKTRRYIVTGYAKVWPRRMFDIKAGGKLHPDVRKALDEPGVYVLYRDDHPHYIGKTSRALRDRIWKHAAQPSDPQFSLWNFFSAFAVPQKRHRDEVEGILIASMPTAANNATPRFPRIKLPARVGTLLRKAQEIPGTPSKDEDNRR